MNVQAIGFAELIIIFIAAGVAGAFGLGPFMMFLRIFRIAAFSIISIIPVSMILAPLAIATSRMPSADQIKPPNPSPGKPALETSVSPFA